MRHRAPRPPRHAPLPPRRQRPGGLPRELAGGGREPQGQTPSVRVPEERAAEGDVAGEAPATRTRLPTPQTRAVDDGVVSTRYNNTLWVKMA